MELAARNVGKHPGHLDAKAMHANIVIRQTITNSNTYDQR